MGMGEPLLNLTNVLPAIQILLTIMRTIYRNKYSVQLYRTIEKLSKETNVSLAISLHAPEDELRNQLVP